MQEPTVLPGGVAVALLELLLPDELDCVVVALLELLLKELLDSSVAPPLELLGVASSPPESDEQAARAKMPIIAKMGRIFFIYYSISAGV
jgi:hypothetical protein